MSDSPGNMQRLLIVDDSKVIRVTARKILQGHFETVEAVDGNNAWELLSSEPPFSLIVSDLTMPGLDGFGLLQKIRASHLPHVANIPVIIITGANDSEATKQRATDAGATDFIGKPFDAVHLLARTQAHADAYSTEQTLTQDAMALEDQALVDPATGLPNEAAFIERGRELLAYAIRHHTALTLFSIDIDNHEGLYRQHGEAATTAAAASVAGVVARCIRQEDVAARTGASRFGLLLPGLSNDGIRNLADRIVQDVASQPLEIGGSAIPLTVSIGIAAPEVTAETGFESLLSMATGNLQKAACQGGNQAAPAMPQIEPAGQDATTPTGVTVDFVAEPAVDPLYRPADAQVAAPAESLELTLEPRPDLDKEPAEHRTAKESVAEELVAEPFPDLEVTGAGTGAVDSMPAQAAADSPAHYPADTYEEEEIVITAPGGYFDLDDQPAETPVAEPARQETPADTMAKDGAASPTPGQDNSNSPVKLTAASFSDTEEPVDDAPPRPGFFARLFPFLRRKH